ncbi:MAG: taurine dioxygenase, partial [Gammaproteobacteria bacterium]|nr:taurine dioxygenase [Gammaproteobacteria bacterium]
MPEAIWNEDVSPIVFKKISPRCGVEILDFDLSNELSQDVVDKIEHLLVSAGVVFFRDQHITREQHIRFGQRFGELHVHPAVPGPKGYPEILLIHADAKSKGVAGAGWHSDVSSDAEPPAASILYMKIMPKVGGDTLFSNMYAAFEALSKPMQEHLLQLKAIHAPANIYSSLIKSEKAEVRNQASIHPVIRTHPISKRKALFVNSIFTREIVGLSKKESDYLLRFLFEHINDPNFQIRFSWQPGSIAFWDNRCVQHFPTDD